MYFLWLIIGIFLTGFESFAQEDVVLVLTTKLSEADLHKAEIESALKFLNVDDSAIASDKAFRILRTQAKPSELIQQASPFLEGDLSSIDRVNTLEIMVSIQERHRLNFISSMRFLSFMRDKIQLMNILLMVSRKDPEEWPAVAFYFKKWIQAEEETISFAMQAINGRDVYNTIEAIFNFHRDNRDGFLDRMRRLMAETQVFEKPERQRFYVKMRSYDLETFCALSRCSLEGVDDLLQITRHLRRECGVPIDNALLLQKLSSLDSSSQRKVLTLCDSLFRPRMTKSDQIWVITTLAGLPVSDWEELVKRAKDSNLWLLPVYAEACHGREVAHLCHAAPIFYTEALVENLQQPL